MNPQFRIRLPQKGDGQGTTCCVLVALMQEYNRRLRKDEVDQLWIGFQIYRVRWMFSFHYFSQFRLKFKT